MAKVPISRPMICMAVYCVLKPLIIDMIRISYCTGLDTRWYRVDFKIHKPVFVAQSVRLMYVQGMDLMGDHQVSQDGMMKTAL